MSQKQQKFGVLCPLFTFLSIVLLLILKKLYLVLVLSDD
jgi:hypothetical protein